MGYGDVSGGTGYPRVELYDADYNKVGTFDLQYAAPGQTEDRRPDIIERPVPLDEFAETVDNETVAIEKGFKIEFEFTWPALDKTGRGELASLISHKSKGGLFKVWPHYGVDGVKGEDDQDRWYMCRLVDFSGIGEYVHGQDGGDAYVGYGRITLVFRATHPVPSIYHDEPGFYFTSVEETEYDPSEVSYFGAVDEDYTAEDQICHFTSVGAVYDAATGQQVIQD